MFTKIKLISFLAILSVGFLFIGGCEDKGTNPPPHGLTLSSTNVTLAVGASTNITVSGGITPYDIHKDPDTTIAKAILSGSTLTITGVRAGQTSVLVRDKREPERDTVRVYITVTAISQVSFSTQIQPIFNASCTGCHGSSGGLNLSASVSHANLVNVNAQSSCTTLKRVLPTNASQSVLYLKVAGTDCGNRMPQGGSLPTQQINLINDWITQGALNN
ncbi:MAG: hypothetical protein Q8K98_07440 [Bacteroidota bacterium]|nr:hypothetical protein [Bacteroidota bacterium]